jgi:hypothetical protein
MPDYFLSARERIHLGTCRYCNNGRGPDLDFPRNWAWEGPFATRAKAFERAKELGYHDVRDCAFCPPQSK